MSSTVRKIKKNMKAEENLKKYTLYGTLIGSVIVTIGKLSGKTEDELMKDFDMFRDGHNSLWDCKNIKEICSYLIKFYKMPEVYKNNIVLCYDEKGIYTPIVTLVDDDGIVQPLDRNGTYIGVLAKDDFEMEFVYEEEN